MKTPQKSRIRNSCHPFAKPSRGEGSSFDSRADDGQCARSGGSRRAIRRAARVVLASLLVLGRPAPIAAASADAGTYHAGPLSICSDCHQRSASNPNARGSLAGLRAGDLSELCLRCHDGKPGIPDVMGDDVNHLTERSGGFFEPLESVNARGHELARRSASAPDETGCGSCHAPAPTAASGHVGLTCVDCHAPHGNGNPRNLRLPSAAGESPSLGLFVSPSAQGLDRYERRNVRYGTLDSDRMREVTALCLDCHRELANAGGPGPGGHHTIHPSYDSQGGARNSIAQGAAQGTTNPSHWVRGTGSGFEGADRVPFLVRGARDFASASAVRASDNAVFCLSCHKAHGSGSAFGLTWAATERGVGPRGCDQCHGLAGAIENFRLSADATPGAAPILPPMAEAHR